MAGYLPGSNVRSDTAQPPHLANAGYSAYADSGNASSLMFAHPSAYTPQGKSTNSQAGYDYYYGYQSAHALAQGSLEHQPIAALYNPNTGQQYPPGRLTNQMGNSPYNWAAVNELSFLPSNEEPHVTVAARLSSIDLGQQLSKPEFTHFTMKHESPHNEQLLFFQNASARGLNMDVPQATRGQTRGLSLSLSPQRPGQMQYYNMQREESSGGNLNDSGFPGTRSTLYMGDRHAQVEPNVMSILRPGGFLSSSKYLKAARQLLDEVVSIKGAVKSGSVNKSKPQSQTPRTSAVNASTAKDFTRTDVNFPAANAMPHPPLTSGIAPSSEPQTSTAPELTPEERQEFQLKQVKLMAMLNEVDKRYRLYYSQMQTVVRAFESEAGIDAAQSYTALALQTISRHFRCLRDAIVSQFRVAQRRLGEETPASPGSGAMKLRLVDQQLRQQHALHQLQMMQQHTWRPQRGLPERSVSILRAWLFEHFLHPYPKDADKLILAKQTGLTRNQVSNWFINARVRLWKPMVEEMYQEETKEAELSANQNSYSGDEEVNPQKDSIEWIEARGNTEAEKQIVLQQQQELHFDGTHSVSEVTTTVDTHLYPDLKKARSSVESSRLGVLAETAMFSAMHDDKKHEGNRSSLEQDNRHSLMMMREMERGFDSYQTGLMRYGTAAMNAIPVSLTLGLQHCDNIEAPHPRPQQYLQAQQPSHSLSYGALPVPSHQIVGGYTNAESLESLAQFHNHKRYPLHDFVG